MGCSKLKVSTTEPCKICGKEDYCFRLDFGSEGLLHCCARVADHGTVIGAGGSFVWKKSKETPIGTYNYYEDSEAIEEKKRKFFESRGRNYQPKKFQSTVKPTSYNQPAAIGSGLIEGEVAVAEADRLDAVYRAFLSLLIIEEWHVKRLKKDWNTEVTGSLYEKVTSRHPIRSLPPTDWARAKARSINYKNMNRVLICRKLVQIVGAPKGVPGFYEKNGNWTFTGTEGILFPIYDTSGRIIRLRVREDYPSIKGVLNGREGNFVRVATGKNICWEFIDKETKQKNFVNFPIDECPPGKPHSKYKNFTSVFEKSAVVDGQTVVRNEYQNGARSSSHASLYCKEGDNFSTVYITEGEKKAMIANMMLNVPVVSLPGTGTFSKLFEKNNDDQSMVDFLVKKGMNLCIIAYDADKGENVRVLKAEKDCVEQFKKRRLQIAIGEWNAAWGKGLDDTLVIGVRPKIYMVA